MRSSNQSVILATQQRLTTCMNALKDVSKVWLVAKMVHTLFESILGNKMLEERLQRAAGRRHTKNKQNGIRSRDAPEPVEHHKRKFDDMELGYPNGPPAPQMSYERSRPQSPAMTPAGDLPPPAQPHTQQIPHISTSSPPIRQSTDAFMGNSRSGTRATTPFNNYSYPGTPPDFFLHTRNSPNISQDLWQNYQPDQLFPPEANVLFPMESPHQQHSMVDPALRPPPPPNQHPSQQPPQQQQFAPPPPSMQSHAQMHPQAQQMPMHAQQGAQQMHPANGQQVPTMTHQTYQQDPNGWAQMQNMSQQRQQQQQQQQQEGDNWSSSTASGPIVPTTLNVGDW